MKPRPLALTLALAFHFGLAGAAFLSGLVGRPVPLLTGRGALGPQENDMVGCYTYFVLSPLTVDATYGTAITEFGHTTPVMWPLGYTGRQVGSEVEILDATGKVRARTGNIYQIQGGYGAHDPDAFVACGYILPKQPGEAPG
jgi:hypothetical protein